VEWIDNGLWLCVRWGFEIQMFNKPQKMQLLISGTSAPTFGNTLLAAGVLNLSK